MKSQNYTSYSLNYILAWIIQREKVLHLFIALDFVVSFFCYLWCTITFCFNKLKNCDSFRLIKKLKMRVNSFNTGIASEYLILSKLYRLELEAYISQGNKKSVDIRVIRKDGTPISIDVKSVRGHSSLVVNNVQPEKNHFLVFVIYNNKFDKLEIDPDIFIVPSEELKLIMKEYKKEKRVMKGDLKAYKDKWEYIVE